MLRILYASYNNIHGKEKKSFDFTKSKAFHNRVAGKSVSR